MTDQPLVAVIGGSGFYTFLEVARTLEVDTPYGSPSAPIAVGHLAECAVAFLPRHGRSHEHPPHMINYRANMWALRSVGVQRVLAPCAVGSLRPDIGRGTLVSPDQLVDCTRGRVQTYFDDRAVHVSFADPYCEETREAVLRTARKQSTPLIDRATMVVVDGPRFSTRAESRFYAAQGWDLVNMTGSPEAVLARELAMCYAAIGLVTDLDAGVDETDAVSQAEVLGIFGDNLPRLAELLRHVIVALPEERSCSCKRVHDGLASPVTLP